jgi:hypothetical protein
MEPTSAPEARQNLIEGSSQFGSVAVRAGDDRWLVANPTNGGHWATDAQVKGWSPGTFATPAVDEDQDQDVTAPNG